VTVWYPWGTGFTFGAMMASFCVYRTRDNISPGPVVINRRNPSCPAFPHATFRGSSGEVWNCPFSHSLCNRNRALGVRCLLLRADGSPPGPRSKSFPNSMASWSVNRTGTRVSPPGAPRVCLVCSPGPSAPTPDHVLCLPSPFLGATGCYVTMSRLLLQICTALPIVTGIVSMLGVKDPFTDHWGCPGLLCSIASTGNTG
jgi:hypothetical protein